MVGELQVPTITLDDLLERNGVKHIDFLSIDVEGHQKEVLDGFDLQRWRPALVCVEDDGPISVPWFKARGYEPIERGCLVAERHGRLCAPVKPAR